MTDMASSAPVNRIGDDDVRVLVLVKTNEGQREQYVFLFDDARRAQCQRMLGDYASREDLSFTWYDAAMLSQKVRSEVRQ